MLCQLSAAVLFNDLTDFIHTFDDKRLDISKLVFLSITIFTQESIVSGIERIDRIQQSGEMIIDFVINGIFYGFLKFTASGWNQYKLITKMFHRRITVNNPPDRLWLILVLWIILFYAIFERKKLLCFQQKSEVFLPCIGFDCFGLINR